MDRELQKRNEDEIFVFNVVRKILNPFRFTFRVARPYNAIFDRRQVWMRTEKGRVLYLGTIPPDNILRITDASDLPATDLAQRVFTFVWQAVNGIIQGNVAMQLPTGVEIYPSCIRCSKKLTKLKDISRGYGPECAKFMDEYGCTW